jgi:hypothetical protein
MCRSVALGLEPPVRSQLRGKNKVVFVICMQGVDLGFQNRGRERFDNISALEEELSATAYAAFSFARARPVILRLLGKRGPLLGKPE